MCLRTCVYVIVRTVSYRCSISFPLQRHACKKKKKTKKKKTKKKKKRASICIVPSGGQVAGYVYFADTASQTPFRQQYESGVGFLIIRPRQQRCVVLM